MKTKNKKLKQKQAGFHPKPAVFNLQKQYFVDVLDDLFYKFTELLNICSLYIDKNIMTKIKQWINLYNNKANKEITLFSRSNFSLSFKPFLLTQGIVVFAFIAISLATIGSFLIPKPQVSQSQIIKKIALKQTSAIIAKGQPIKWTITVKRSDISSDQAGQHLVKLPKTAKNIKVKTITKQEAQALSLKNIPQADAQLTIKDRKKLVMESNNNFFIFTASLFSKFSKLFLASVTADADQVVEAATQDIVKTDDAKLVDLSAQAISPTSVSVEQPSTDTLQTVSSSDQAITTAEPIIGEPTESSVGSSETTSSSDQQITQTEEVQKQDEIVQIDFETPAPIITEQETSEGKQVTVSDPNTDPAQPQLTNVLAFTTIPEIFKVGEESKIQIKWQNNADQDMQFHAYDLNNNGKLDYVEWTVPHLSQQIFTIIFISKAFQLDQNKNIIADIYDTVNTKNQNYATIETNQYVRVTFAKTLTNQNDITLYARATNVGQPARIEVYPVYPDGSGGDQIIATFDSIDNENTYRILLTNLQTPTDVFDLKIVNNNVDIDYIVDPAVIYYWVGSAGGNTSVAANWATAAGACTGAGDGAVPTSIDTATFTSNCVNNATINATFSVATVTINSGYTGTITQSSGITITIATDWTQAGGTFTGGNSSFTTNYAVPLTISGGTFNATSGTMFLGGAFTISAGTFNAGTGTVQANNNDSPIWDFAATTTFNNFTLNKTSDDGNLYIGSTDPADVNTWNVNGTLTLGEGKISSQNHHSTFTLNAKGPISVLVTHDGGGGGTTTAQTSNDYTADILSINGAGDQSFTIPAGAKMMGTTLNNSLTTISTSGSGTITWMRRLTVTAGTVNAGSVNHVLYNGLTVNGGTFTGGSGTVSVTNDVTISSGTLTAPSSTLSVSFPSISLVSNSLKTAYGWTHTAGGTFTHNSGTVQFDGDPNTTTTIDVATSEAFNNLTVNLTGATTMVIASGDTLTANGTYTWTDGNIDTGTVDAKSTVVVGATADGHTTTVSTLSLSGSGTQTCTLNGGGEVSALTINNASATCTVTGSGTFTFAGSFTLTNGVFNGGSITNDFKSTTSATTGVTISAGTFTASSGNTQVARGFTHTAGGTFTNNSGTVVLNGGILTTINVGTSETFNNLTIARTSSVTALTITSGTTLIVAGTLTLTDGVVNTGTLAAQGAVTIGSAYDGGSAILNFTGTANQTFTDNSTGSKPTGTWTINKSSGTVTLATNMVVNASGQDLAITSGTLDLAGFNLTVNDQFTLGASGTLQLQGGETVSALSTITAGSTVNYNGTTSYTGLKMGNTYSNLTFSGSGGTWTLNNALTVNNNLTITAGTLDVSASGCSSASCGISITGNHSNSGTFTARTGTVTLAGTNQTISGTTTFYNLTKSVTTADTLTFTAGTTQTISNTLTLNGIANNLLSLRSSSTPTQWSINPQGTRTLSYLDVKDSNNTNATAIATSDLNITDSGNTTNWTFDITPPTINSGPDITKSDTFTTTATASDAGSGIASYQWSKVSGSGTVTFGTATSLNTTVSLNSTDTTYVIRLTVTDVAGNSGSDDFTLRWSTSSSTGGGGNAYSNTSLVQTVQSPSIPEQVVNHVTQVPEKVAEKVVEQTNKITNNIAEQAQNITNQISQIQQQLANLIRPKEQKPTEIVGVPKETPFAFQNIGELLPLEPIKQFVLGPLPQNLQFFTERFVGLKNTLREVGVSKISDIVKLEDANFKLPGLLSFETKQKIPTEIVFAKTGDGLIDLNIALSINKEGTPEQGIRTIVGKPLELVIKPDKPVKKIKGYLIFKRKNTELGFLQNLLQISQASLIGSSVGQTQNNNTGVEQKLVLQEFDYTDADKDGIYSANIQTPVVDGEYEIVTVMNYEDPKLALRELQLTVVVDPEGYIYEQLPSGQLRINSANVSLYWLNSETKNYELWPAQKYLQDNPYTTDKTGKYSFLVPEGEYYLKVVANNYFAYQTNPFTVTKSEGIHMDIKMQKKSWWGILIDWFKNLKNK